MSARSGGGRPVAGYRLANGSKIPSVTTIVGRFKESGGLIRWAWKLGIDGKDFRKEKDDAASAGSLAHDLIEADILGHEPILPSANALAMTTQDYETAIIRARTGFEAFRAWRRAVSLEIVATETPLVSEGYRYGGTIDAVARISGALAIFDWKSSNRIYQDYIVQVAAYRQLWEENHSDERIESIHLVRVGKEFGDFHHHCWPLPLLETAWRAFLLERELFDLDALLKRAAA